MNDRPALLASLEHELVGAAGRLIRPPSPRRRYAVLVAATLAGVAGTTTAALAVLGDGIGSSPPRYGTVPPEPDLRYDDRPVLLARAVDRTGPRFEIVGYRLARRGSSQRSRLCLDLVDLPGRGASGCLSDSGYVQGTSSGSLTGAAEADVARVVVRYRLDGGRRGRAEALLARATDERALGRLGLAPFSIWRALLPKGAYAKRVQGVAADGRVRWTAVDPLELSACADKRRRTSRCQAIAP